jgi:hypothetical protein
VLSDQSDGARLRPAAALISGSSYRSSEKTQGETRRPGHSNMTLST